MPSAASKKGSPPSSTSSSSKPSLRMMARKELQEIRAKKRLAPDRRPEQTLLDFIPSVSPHLIPPLHLKEAADRFENFRTAPFEFVFSVPPRHGKTELVKHFIVWALKLDPTLRIAYITYAQNQAEDMSAEALKIAHEAGLDLSRETRSVWETPEGGKVIWTGVGGALTGKGFNLVIVDDPVRNRIEAESPVHRDRAWDMFRSDLYSRLQRGGIGNKVEPSICVIQTRWHDDDLAGRLTKGSEEEGIDPWFAINIPAIANEDTENEQALCEEIVPLRRLKKIRSTVGPYAWTSLYQGRPRPRGTTVFGDPKFYTAPPFTYRAAQGLDLSYTEKKTSDSSVVATLLEEDGLIYVRRVVKRQVRAPDFKDTLRSERARFPHSNCRIYAAGTELGALDFFKQEERDKTGKAIPGADIEVLAPEGDKFTRAIPFAAAWNSGRVVVPDPTLIEANPEEYGWVNDYLDELKAFTGVKDTHDDQVDASVAAYDVLEGPVATFDGLPTVTTKRRSL